MVTGLIFMLHDRSNIAWGNGSNNTRSIDASVNCATKERLREQDTREEQLLELDQRASCDWSSPFRHNVSPAAWFIQVFHRGFQASGPPLPAVIISSRSLGRRCCGVA